MDFLTESLKDRMLFAIPKKGRLYEKCLELLAGADIQFTRSNRLDIALARNHPLALIFLPAADIPRFVSEGNIDLGITGQDMVAEASLSPEYPIVEVLKLGFGKCKLQVQVPERGPYKKVGDLAGRKVVTSFENLAARYFADVDAQAAQQAGSAASTSKKTVIEYIGGSVEAACALGLADGIVDLVESGETMRAAGLTPIETILESQAVLIRSQTPKQAISTPLIKLITSRIEGVLAAAQYVLCEYNIPRDLLSQGVKITPGRRAPTVTALDDQGWVAVSAMVNKSNSAVIMDQLQELGAHDIFIIELKNCRV